MAGLPHAGSADEKAKDYVRGVLDEFSCMQPYREYASACSYCRRPKNKGRVAYGNQVKSLTVADYEHILERGWIRCGHHIYQPQNERSCCPNLGIRLDAMLFTPSKEQLKVLHQAHKYLTGERPILLPPDDRADVLEQLLTMAEAGKAHEAAELVVRHRLKGVSAFGGAEESEEECEAGDVGAAGKGAATGGAGAGSTGPARKPGAAASAPGHASPASTGRMTLAQALAAPLAAGDAAAAGSAATPAQKTLHAAAAAAASAVLSLLASRATRPATAAELRELLTKVVVSEHHHPAQPQPAAAAAAAVAGSSAGSAASAAAGTSSDSSGTASFSLNAAFIIASAPYWPAQPAAAPAAAAAASSSAGPAAPAVGGAKGRRGSAPGPAGGSGNDGHKANPRVAGQLEIAAALASSLESGGLCSSASVSGPGAVALDVPAPLPIHTAAAAGSAWATALEALTAALRAAPDGAAAGSAFAFLEALRQPQRPAAKKDGGAAGSAAGGAGAGAADAASGASAGAAGGAVARVTDDADDPEGCINCLTAHTPAQRRALAARYRRMQVAREAAGLRAFVADPLGYWSLRPDEDGVHPPSDMLGEEELDFALEQGKKGEDGDGDDFDDADGSSDGGSENGCDGDGSGFDDAVEDKETAADSARAADAALATGGASDSASPAATGAGAGSSSGSSKAATGRSPKPLPGSRAWKEAQRARRIRRVAAAKEAKDVAKSEAELKTFLASGMGGQMRQLRARAEAFARSAAIAAGAATDAAAVGAPAAASSAGAPAAAAASTASADSVEKLVRAAVRGLPRNRAPAVAPAAASSSAAAAGSAGAGAGADAASLPPHLLLPFGRGPLRLRVRLVRPRYTLESHELYTRFNMSLHRGTPASNTAASYTRHLIDTPVPYMAPSDIGLCYRWGGALAGQPAVPPPAADPALGCLFANWTVPASPEAAAAAAPVGARSSFGSSAAAVSAAEAGNVPPVALRGLGARHALLAAAAGSLGMEDVLAPGEIGPAVLASVAEGDALCAWVLSVVARRTEVAERARLRRAARRAARKAAREAAGGAGASSSSSAAAAAADPVSAILRSLGGKPADDDDDDAADDEVGPASGKVDHDDAAEPDGSPLPLIQAVPPLPAVLDPLAASLMDLAADLNLPPAALLLALLAIGDVIVGQTRKYHNAMVAHHEAAAAAAAEEAAAAAAGGAGDPKRARLAGDADASGAAQRRSSGAASGAQSSELAQMRAAMRSLSSMLGLPPGSLGDDMGLDDDDEAGMGMGMGGGSAGNGDGASGRRIPPKPVVPAGWLSPQTLFSQWTNVLTAAEDSVAWVLEAARAHVDGIYQSVRTAAAYNQERPAPVPAAAAAQLAPFMQAVPSDGAAAGASTSSSFAAAGGAGSSAAASPSEGAGAAANRGSHGSISMKPSSKDASKDSASEPRILVDGWELRRGFGSFFQEYWLESDAGTDADAGSRASAGAEADASASVASGAAGTAAAPGGRGFAPVLLAVGVLDVLPSRVASIYFFYNPSFRHLSLGKLSAQVEVFLAQQIYAHCAAAPGVLALPPGLPPLCRWWDANLIAHAVSTMSYKRRFAPSQLMCPRLGRGHWVDLTREVQLALDMDLSHPLGPHRTWPALPQPARAHPKLADVAPIAAAARAEAESLGASLDAVEAAEAEELMPSTLHLLPPSNRSAALYGGLTGHAQDLLRRGLRRFMAAAGPTLCRRVVFDPSWMAALESRERSEKSALAEFKRARAAAAAAAPAALAPAGGQALPVSGAPTAAMTP